MKRIVFSFAIGVGVGVWGHWYLQQEQGRRAMADAKETVVTTAERAKEAVLRNINPDEIKEELHRTGMVIREKARSAGQSVATAAADTATTAAVKSKLISEPGLHAGDISVETTAGVVTLSGSVSSYDEIGKAMKLALETEGAQKVVSKLQVTSAR